MNHGGRQINQAERVLPELGASTLRCSRFVLLALLLLVCGAAALAIDCPLSKWCLNCRWPEYVERVLQIGESFGSGIGAVMLILVAFQLAPERRRMIPRVVAITFGAGVAADLLKLLVVRVRPHHFDFAGGVWQTFGEWLPVGSGGSGHQSLPSGHTAVAVGLAIALVWFSRRGFWLFFGLAALAACQRVASGAHYLSDVLFAAALASSVAFVCLVPGRLSAWFERRESPGLNRFLAHDGSGDGG